MTNEGQCTPDPGTTRTFGKYRTSPVLIAQPSWMGYPNFPCVNSPAIVDGLIGIRQGREGRRGNLREELDLVSLSSEGSNTGFDNSDLPVQAAEPTETTVADQLENCGGESPGSETDSTESESEEPPAAAAWIWQQQRQQQGKYVSPAHSHDRSAMMGGKMCRQQDGRTTVVRGKMAQPSAS